MKGSKFLLTLIVAGLLVIGCSQKRIESTETPKAPEKPVVEKPVAVPAGQYTVVAHDTLWGIAGKSDIYSDNFEWPLIFKANRDIIKDPDLIYPKQDFKINKGVSSEDMKNAKDLAMKTPKYVPHTQPRTTLPIDYF
jgi:LysM repeat protein